MRVRRSSAGNVRAMLPAEGYYGLRHTGRRLGTIALLALGSAQLAPRTAHAQPSAERAIRLAFTVRTAAPRADHVVDVYSATTGYVGWANLGSINPVGFMANGRLVSLEVDELNVPKVVVYDVTRR